MAADTRKFMVWFDDDTLSPVPVRATGRAEAFRIGERYRNTNVAAAVDGASGEDFGDIPQDAFVTEADV